MGENRTTNIFEERAASCVKRTSEKMELLLDFAGHLPLNVGIGIGSSIAAVGLLEEVFGATAEDREHGKELVLAGGRLAGVSLLGGVAVVAGWLIIIKATS